MSQAAKSVDLTYSQLRKFIARKRKGAGVETATKLRELVGPQGADVFDQAFLPKGAAQLLRSYAEWLPRRIERFLSRREPYWTLTKRGPRRSIGGQRARMVRVLQYGDLLRRIRRQHTKQLKPLEAAFNRLRCDDLRKHVSYLRILEPLLEGRDTGFIERFSTELDPKELADFVAAGVKREVILLKRLRDRERAKLALEPRSPQLERSTTVAVLAHHALQKPLLPWHQ